MGAGAGAGRGGGCGRRGAKGAPWGAWQGAGASFFGISVRGGGGSAWTPSAGSSGCQGAWWNQDCFIRLDVGAARSDSCSRLAPSQCKGKLVTWVPAPRNRPSELKQRAEDAACGPGGRQPLGRGLWGRIPGLFSRQHPPPVTVPGWRQLDGEQQLHRALCLRRSQQHHLQGVELQPRPEVPAAGGPPGLSGYGYGLSPSPTRCTLSLAWQRFSMRWEHGAAQRLHLVPIPAPGLGPLASGPFQAASGGLSPAGP